MQFFLPHELSPQGWLTDMLLAQIHHAENDDIRSHILEGLAVALSNIDSVIDINGKTILITDEDWNLGEYVAEELESNGAKVILLSLDSTAKEFSPGRVYRLPRSSSPARARV